MSQTPATTVLDAADISYRVLPYEHDDAAESYGMEAAEVLGLDPDCVFKTLMASTDGGDLAVAIVPVSARLDLKALARVAGVKKAFMADPAVAERATGYVVGGISPLGQRKAHPTFIDETAELVEEIYVSGGRRGLDLAVAPQDLISVTAATVGPIALW